jgi:hypothetical protein
MLCIQIEASNLALDGKALLSNIFIQLSHKLETQISGCSQLSKQAIANIYEYAPLSYILFNLSFHAAK